MSRYLSVEVWSAAVEQAEKERDEAKADIQRAMKVGYTRTLDCQTAEEMAADLVCQIDEARQRAEQAEKERDEAVASMRKLQAQRDADDLRIQRAEKERDELSRLAGLVICLRHIDFASGESPSAPQEVNSHALYQAMLATIRERDEWKTKATKYHDLSDQNGKAFLKEMLRAEAAEKELGRVRFELSEHEDELLGRAESAEKERDEAKAMLSASEEAQGKLASEWATWLASPDAVPSLLRRAESAEKERDESRASLERVRDMDQRHLDEFAAERLRYEERIAIAESKDVTKLRQRAESAEAAEARVRELEATSAEDAARLDKAAYLLRRTADALKGSPAPLAQHSWHDLPEVADNLVAQAAAMREALEHVDMLTLPCGHDGDEESGLCDEDCERCCVEAVKAHAEHAISSDAGRAMLERVRKAEADAGDYQVKLSVLDQELIRRDCTAANRADPSATCGACLRCALKQAREALELALAPDSNGDCWLCRKRIRPLHPDDVRRRIAYGHDVNDTCKCALRAAAAAIDAATKEVRNG